MQLKKAINNRIDKPLLENLDTDAVEFERSQISTLDKAVTAYFDTLDEMISDKKIDDLKR